MVYDWCDENGVALTGHYVQEESLGDQIMCCGGIIDIDLSYTAESGVPGEGRKKQLKKAKLWKNLIFR